MKTNHEYNKELNKGLYYENGFVTLVFNFDKDEVEEMYNDYSEDEINDIITDLTKEKEAMTDDYDVKAEQGIFGYGY